MARSISEIQAAIVAAKNADPVLSVELTSTSAVSVWLLWTYIVATVMWSLENLFDLLKLDVAAKIAAEKAHTPQWYATMAKRFQYGDTLPADTDTYSPVAAAGDASLIVSFACTVELASSMRIKVAKGTVGALAPLSVPELAAFTTYMNRIKDGGVRLRITSGIADNLKVKLNVYYDPLILDNTGARLDGTAATPVEDAINAFLDSLPFNGLFVFNSFIAALQAIDGVKIGEVLLCQANYAATPYVDIMAATPNQYTPDAGYMALDDVYFNANVNYTAYSS